jgi:hypothetical protein
MGGWLSRRAHGARQSPRGAVHGCAGTEQRPVSVSTGARTRSRGNSQADHHEIIVSAGSGCAFSTPARLIRCDHHVLVNCRPARQYSGERIARDPAASGVVEGSVAQDSSSRFFRQTAQDRVADRRSSLCADRSPDFGDSRHQHLPIDVNNRDGCSKRMLRSLGGRRGLRGRSLYR